MYDRKYQHIYRYLCQIFDQIKERHNIFWRIYDRLERKQYNSDELLMLYQKVYDVKSSYVDTQMEQSTTYRSAVQDNEAKQVALDEVACNKLLTLLDEYD